LSPPLSFRQGIALNDAKGLQSLYRMVADPLESKVPARDFEVLASELASVCRKGKSGKANIGLLETAASDEKRVFSHVRLLIDSSGIPMYMTNRKLVVLHCNRHLEQLLDSSQGSLNGKPLTDLINRFAARVPKSKRKSFLARQKDLVGTLLEDLRSHSEACAIIGNSKIAGNEYQGSYRVWISADKINLANKDIGLFVLYRPEKISRKSRKRNRSVKQH